ncbi:hypothetical protein [Prosthecobacter sp.]|uniref:hypothetical protein n=1 Tax=Prosthecobacter sp. TaxID=1965333 RepID=UPI0037843981
MNYRSAIEGRWCQKACVILLLPALTLHAGPPGADEASQPPPKRGFLERVQAWWRGGKPEPRSAGDVVLDQGRAADGLKKEMDEWGTMAIAPLLYAPGDPSYYKKEGDANDTRPAHPFRMEEGTAPQDAAEQLTLNGLYGAYNVANGQSLFGQRTQTRVLAEAGVKVDAVAQAVETAKMALFQENLSKARQTTVNNRAAAVQNTQEQQARMAKAQAAADKADADLEEARRVKTDATVARIQAEGDVTVAGLKKDNAAAALKTATDDQQAAVKREDDAKDDPAKLALATADRMKADENLAAAKANYDAAVADQQAKTLLVPGATARETKASADFTAVEERQKAASAEAGSARSDLTAARKAELTAENAQTDFPDANHVPKTSDISDPLNAAKLSDIKTLMDKVSDVGTVGGKDKLLPAVPTGAGSFPPLARINAAASALTVKNILSFLGNPEAAAAFADKRILFGVTTLSVNPGWRTKQDFKGVIDAKLVAKPIRARDETIREMVNCADYPIGLRAAIAHSYPRALTEEQRQFFKHKKDFTFKECQAYSQPPRQNMTLMVHAVSPMVDAQNLDLASSIARQDEVALYLSATLAQAGAAGAGNLFTSWAKERRKDVATRSTMATANSFSMGDHFGFEIGTRLRGLDDDDAKGNKAAQTLDRQTFPVLLILGMSKADAMPTLEVEQVKGGFRFNIYEPHIVLDYSARWSRTHHSMWTAWYKPNRSPSDGYAEVLKNGRVFERAETDFKTAVWPEKGSPYRRAIHDTKDNVSRELDSLEKGLYGAGYDQGLPAKWMLNTPSTVTLFDPDAKVNPHRLSITPPRLEFTGIDEAGELTVILRGENLNAVNPEGIEVVGAGVRVKPASRKVRSQDSLSLTLQATGTAATGKVAFVLPYASSKDSMKPDEIDFIRGSETTDEIGFELKDHELPVIAEGAEADLIFTGGYNATTKHWSKQVSLLLKGTRLDRLPNSGTLRGSGLFAGTQPVEVQVTKKGPYAAEISFLLETDKGVGQIFFEFPAVAGSQIHRVYSSPVNFSFADANPDITPWTPEELETRLVHATGNDNDGYTASLAVMVKGSGLKQVTTATLGGDFTGTAEVVANPEALVVTIKIRDAFRKPTPAGKPAPKEDGKLYLAFPKPGGGTLATGPLSLKLVP